jgi:UDP-N-acetylmuramoyl-L-alanyl-D-glutamate--2,6-diaminopimelate ligase
MSGEKCGLIGTNENIVGDKVYEAERTTPESYDLHRLFREMADSGCKYAVMEVSSHSLVTGRVEGVCFDVGVFTNLTQDHLDFHVTMEAYRDAKARLFDISKTAVINLDDPVGPHMKDYSKCPVITYSAKNDIADLVAKDIKLKESRVDFCAVAIGKIERMELHIPGMFSVYNALATIACCTALGFSLPEISAALKECSGVKGRVEVVPVDADYTVIIDYAHSPDALEKILKTVKGFAKARVIVVFGCGGERDIGKRPMMGRIASELADYVVVSSDNPRSEDPETIIDDVVEGMKGLKTPFKRITDRPEAVRWALSHAKTDDIIVLAGKGHEDYQVIGTEKLHQDEREVIAEYFAGKKK